MAQHITKIVTHYSIPRPHPLRATKVPAPRGGRPNLASPSPRPILDQPPGRFTGNLDRYQAGSGNTGGISPGLGPGSRPPGVGQPGGPPGAPPAPPGNPQPFDSVYENTVSGINRHAQDTLAGLQYQQGQLGSTYGYQADQQGNLSVDPSNPFSKAALLQRSYDQGQNRTLNSRAAGGQLYSGSTQNALNAGTLGFQQNTDALKRAYQSAVQNIVQRRQQALTSQYIDTNTAQADALQRALANRPDPNTTAPADQGSPTGLSQQTPGFFLRSGVTLAKGQKLQPGALAMYKGRKGKLGPTGGWHPL